MVKGYKFYSYLTQEGKREEFGYKVEYADYCNDYSPAKAKAKLIRQAKRDITKWSNKGYKVNANIYCDGNLIKTI